VPSLKKVDELRMATELEEKGTAPLPSASPIPAPENSQATPAGFVTSIAPAIEPDTELHDDPGYVTDKSSTASTSMSASVRDYNFENGRRYHKFQEGRYHFPNDEPEKEREDMKHAMIVHLCAGKLHYAPLDNPHKILDVGTGTGAWVIDSKFRVIPSFKRLNKPGR
jgi:hypothetical protein